MTWNPGPLVDLADAEAELLSALGWSAHLLQSRHEYEALGLLDGLDLEVFTSEPLRRVAAAMGRLRQWGERFRWTDVYDELTRSDSVDDRDALELLPRLATAGGWPALVPMLHAELVRRAEERRRWRDAVSTLEEIAGAPVRVEVAA